MLQLKKGQDKILSKHTGCIVSNHPSWRIMSSEIPRQALRGILQLTGFRNFNLQWLVLLRVMRKHKNGHICLVALKTRVYRCSVLHSIDRVFTARTNSCIGCWEKLSHVNGNMLAFIYVLAKGPMCSWDFLFL